MTKVYRRSCGMDVHKETIVVCVLPPVGGEGKVIRKVYGTFRNDLIRMRVWLRQLKVTEIAMESTGVYWRPVWNVLEDEGFRMLLVNPAQVKALARPKSDGRDAQRIAEYLQDGRLDGSFVPRAEVRQLRPCCGTGSRCWSNATRFTIIPGSFRNGERKAVLGAEPARTRTWLGRRSPAGVGNR